MKRAGFFDLLEEKKTKDFVDGVNELVARWRFRPEAWDRSIGVRRAWLVLLLSAAILCRAFESGAATMESSLRVPPPNKRGSLARFPLMQPAPPTT
jgi:hypothetical protein